MEGLVEPRKVNLEWGLLLFFPALMYGTLKTALPAGATPEFIQKLADSNRNLATLRTRFGIQFDYSEHSLTALDDVISECWSGPPKKMEVMVAMFGSYLGETIRRQLGGKWAEDEGGYHLIDVSGVDARIDPFSKMRKRFLDGSAESLSSYFAAIKVVAAEVSKDKRPD